MKVTNIFAAYIGTIGAIALGLSCTKQTGKTVSSDNYNLNAKTLVQVYNATVNSTRTYVFVDGARVTGVGLAYAGVFPSSGYGFAIDPGQRAFLVKDTLATSAQIPLSFAENLEPGKHYTIYLYDTTTAAKQILVKDNIVIPNDTTARVKFANFLFLKSGVAPGVDVYSKNMNANIFTNVLPTQVTEYIPYDTRVADSIFVRQAGTMNTLDTAVFTFTRKRNYTLIMRGRYANNEAGGATFPRTLSSFTNY